MGMGWNLMSTVVRSILSIDHCMTSSQSSVVLYEREQRVCMDRAFLHATMEMKRD